MKAVVTGITGFAGSHLAAHLLSQGDRVVGLARSSAWPEDVPTALRQIPLVRWDLGEEELPPPAALAELQQFAPDCIFHLAALSLPSKCGDADPTPEAVAVNVEGTARVVRLAGRLPGRPRVLFSSSSKVYGHAERPPWRVPESWPLRPATGYAKSKAAAEERLVAEAATAGVPWIVARSFQHAGPRQPAELMLAEWARQCARRTSEVVVRNRTTLLDHSDVADVVTAYRQLASRGQPNHIYNVGSGTAQCSGDVLTTLMQVGNWWPKVRETSPGCRHEWIADNRRLRQDTFWRPTVPLVRTVSQVLEYWRQIASTDGNLDSKEMVR